jgi:hypothetical protein
MQLVSINQLRTTELLFRAPTLPSRQAYACGERSSQFREAQGNPSAPLQRAATCPEASSRIDREKPGWIQTRGWINPLLMG